jgi:hypothetical protein
VENVLLLTLVWGACDWRHSQNYWKEVCLRTYAVQMRWSFATSASEVESWECKASPVTRQKIAKESITMLQCVNSVSGEKFMPIVIGKSFRPHCFKDIKTFFCILCKLKSMDEHDHLYGLLRVLCLRGCTYCCGQLCYSLTRYVISKDVKIVCCPPNYTSVLQPLDLGIIKCSKQLYRKLLVRWLCVWWTWKGCWTEYHCFAHDTFHSTGSSTSHTCNNCALFLSVWLWMWT